VLYKLGGNSGGLTLFVEDGILCYEYNLFIIQRTKIRAKEKLPTGRVKIEIETRYVVPKPGGPLKVTMKVGGNVVAEGTVPISAPLLFTANDCLDIGIALGSPVSLDYCDKAPFKFNGTIERVHVMYGTRIQWPKWAGMLLLSGGSTSASPVTSGRSVSPFTKMRTAMTPILVRVVMRVISPGVEPWKSGPVTI
jgi:hypothetical protein